MPDFNEGSIELRSTTNIWGPFNWDFTNGIPSGDSISSFTTAAYIGEVKPTADVTNLTDISASLIETSPSPGTNGTIISLYFQWPGDAYVNSVATLIFNVTFTSQSGVHPFIWKYVDIQSVKGLS